MQSSISVHLQKSSDDTKKKKYIRIENGKKMKGLFLLYSIGTFFLPRQQNYR